MSNFLMPTDLKNISKVADFLGTVDYGLSFKVEVFDENGDRVGYIEFNGEACSYVFVTTLED